MLIWGLLLIHQSEFSDTSAIRKIERRNTTIVLTGYWNSVQINTRIRINLAVHKFRLLIMGSGDWLNCKNQWCYSLMGRAWIWIQTRCNPFFFSNSSRSPPLLDQADQHLEGEDWPAMARSLGTSEQEGRPAEMIWAAMQEGWRRCSSRIGVAALEAWKQSGAEVVGRKKNKPNAIRRSRLICLP